MMKNLFSSFRKGLRRRPRKNTGQINKLPQKPDHPNYAVPLSLAEKTEIMGKLVGHSNDIVFRRFNLGFTDIQVIAVYAQGMANSHAQNQAIFKSLMLYEEKSEEVGGGKREITGKSDPALIYELVKDNLIITGQLTEHEDLWEAAIDVLSGDTVLLFDGVNKILSVRVRQVPQKNIEDSEREVSIRGPQTGFSEVLETKIAQLRNKIKHPALKIESIRGGVYTNTGVVMAYLQGIVNPELVEEARRRLERVIHVDGIWESGVIEELIEDNPFSPFPQVEITERPDKAAAQLISGRVVIMMDGSPNVLIVPTIFWQFIQASDDFYQRLIGFALRPARVIALLLTLFLPSIYVALTTYHREMIPLSLLMAISAAREGVPFPAFVEAFIMEGIFEFLREAGLRLPMQIGQALSIVGALVLGQAAIQANLVSPAMVIVVATTAVMSFMIPAFHFSVSLRLLRFVVLIFAATLGFFGMLLMAVFLLTHVVSLRSFGVPYLSPLAPLNLDDLKDVLLRLPVWSHKYRPLILRPQDIKRQDEGLKPVKPRPEK